MKEGGKEENPTRNDFLSQNVGKELPLFAAK
jgi:hypothetical protein